MEFYTDRQTVFALFEINTTIDRCCQLSYYSNALFPFSQAILLSTYPPRPSHGDSLSGGWGSPACMQLFLTSQRISPMYVYDQSQILPIQTDLIIKTAVPALSTAGFGAMPNPVGGGGRWPR